MPKFAANLSMLFTELPFLERFEAAANAGFTGVEFLFPYEHDPAEIKARLDANGLQQVLFNLRPGDWDKGERGIAIFSHRRDEFRDSVHLAVRYAKALDCGMLHCLSGITPPAADQRDMRRTLVENLCYAADALAGEGLKLLIEPINTWDIPGYFLDTSAKAQDIIESVRADNVHLQYDVYHMQIMEGDLAPTIAKRFEHIAHVQIADTPGRHEPGTGEINFPFIFDHLDRLGYTGWVGCEYRPRTTTHESLAWWRKLRGVG